MLGNQCTAFLEEVLKMIIINDNSYRDDQNEFDFPTVYLFRLNVVQLPTHTTGFIYFLVSRRYTEEIYIWSTRMFMSEKYTT